MEKCFKILTASLHSITIVQNSCYFSAIVILFIMVLIRWWQHKKDEQRTLQELENQNLDIQEHLEKDKPPEYSTVIINPDPPDYEEYLIQMNKLDSNYFYSLLFYTLFSTLLF